MKVGIVNTMNDNKYIGSIILEAAPMRDTKEDVIISPKSERRVVAETVLIDCEVLNRNKRMYSTSDMRREVEGPRLKELIESGNMRGHDGHPLSNDILVQQTIDPKLCSVKFTKIWMDKDIVRAHYRGTNNALGEAVDQDLRDGDMPSFSLRALGVIKNENGKAYVRNLRVITWDRVIYPSHKAAYTKEIISEQASIYEQYTGKKYYKSDYDKMLENVNENGLIIPITSSMAKDVVSRLQKESASLDTIFETFSGIADKLQVVGNHILLTTAFGESVYIPYGKYVDNLIRDYVNSI